MKLDINNLTGMESKRFQRASTQVRIGRSLRLNSEQRTQFWELALFYPLPGPAADERGAWAHTQITWITYADIILWHTMATSQSSLTTKTSHIPWYYSCIDHHWGNHQGTEARVPMEWLWKFQRISHKKEPDVTGDSEKCDVIFSFKTPLAPTLHGPLCILRIKVVDGRTL